MLRFLSLKKNFVRQIPISKRIVLLVLFVSIIPILIVSVFSYVQSYFAIQKTATDYNVRMLSSINQTIRSVVSAGCNFSDNLLASDDIRLLASRSDSLDSLSKNTAIRNALEMVRSQQHAMAYIYEVSVITSNHSPAFSMGFMSATQEDIERHLSKASKCDTSELWFIDTLRDKPTIVLVRPIIHWGTLEQYGYLFVYISPDFFSLSQYDVSASRSMSLTFTDSFGQLLPITTPSDPIPSNDIFQEIRSAKSSDVATQYSNSSSDFICYVTVPELGWKLVSSVPYSELLKPLQPIAYASILSVAICLLASILISHSIIASISKPLNKMVDYLGHASDTRFETELVDNANDELGYLAQSYNKICSQMRNLVAQIEDEQAHKRKAEIKMLQAQINPHFLFNTLDSLRFTAMLSNASSVSEGLSSLSHILRNSILKSDTFIPLEREITNIRDYIVIQKIRYGETINLNVDLDASAENAQIMKLLLQPIVENSIIHGMTEEQPITINITARVEHCRLSILIQDNGKGFDPDVKAEDDQQTKSNRMSGVGLNNVRERLSLEYKDQQSFSIQSQLGQGTRVQISLPYTPFQQGEKHV